MVAARGNNVNVIVINQDQSVKIEHWQVLEVYCCMELVLGKRSG